MKYNDSTSYNIILVCDLFQKVIRGFFLRRKYSSKSFVAIGKGVRILGKKKDLIIGIRKTHKFVPNHKTSDFLVPYTSSGCTAGHHQGQSQR